jgi:cytochrome c oxidase subunit I+III
MGVTLLANGALYLSLLFGWFYLWTVSPQWQVPVSDLNGWLMLTSALLLSAGTLWLHRLIKRLRAGIQHGLMMQLAVIALVAFVQSAMLLWLMLSAGLAPTETAHDAVIFVMLAYNLIHCTLAAVLTGLQAWRVSLGYVGDKAPYEPVVVEQLWYYNLGVLWVSYAAIVLFPATWGGA